MTISIYLLLLLLKLELFFCKSRFNLINVVNKNETELPKDACLKCLKNFYTCSSTCTCIPNHLLCDGIEDCVQADDETNCPLNSSSLSSSSSVSGRRAFNQTQGEPSSSKTNLNVTKKVFDSSSSENAFAYAGLGPIWVNFGPIFFGNSNTYGNGNDVGNGNNNGNANGNANGNTNLN